MAYEDEVIADTPLAYWRMDETTLTASPVTIPDASGNGHALPFKYFDFGSDGYNPLGFTSGIETDLSSRSVHIQYPPLAFVDGEDWSRGEIASASWFHLLGDFTLEAWINGGTWDELFGGTDRFFLGTDDFWLGMDFVGGDPPWRFATFCTTNDNTKYVAMGSSVAPEDDTFYYLVAIRVLNSISIYVNAQLAATTILPALPTRNSSGIFFVGANDRTLNQPGEIDEVAVYDYALSLTRIQAHHAAGRATLPMSARIQMRNTYVLDSGEAVPPAAFAFRHNWDRPVREELEYNGRILRGGSGNEQAYVLDEAPRRKISYEIPTNTANATARLNSLLWYAGTQQSRVRIPILHYKDTLAAPLSSGSTTIPVSTAYKDYDVGAHVMLAQYGRSFDITDFETAQIATVAANEITITTATENDWPAGTVIAPMRRCILERPIKHTLWTPAAASRLIDARIIPDDNPETRNRITAWTPAQTYAGFELFNPFTWFRNDNPQPEIEHNRDVDLIDFGNGRWSVSQPQDAPEETITMRYVIEGIDEISSFLGWLDYRQGTTRAMWLPTCRPDFEKTGQLGSDLGVTGINYTTNYALHAARARLAFIASGGGTITPRAVTAAVDNGDGTETLTLDSSVPAANSYSCISFLWLARLDHNLIAIDWITQCIIQVELRFRNILSSE